MRIDTGDHNTAAYAAIFSWAVFAVLTIAASNHQPPRSGSTRIDGIDTAESKEIKPLAELEKAAIRSALTKLNGDKVRAAKLLGIGKTTLYRKLQEYDINVQSSFT